MSQTEWMNSVFSDGSPQFVNPSFPCRGENIKIRLRAFKSAPIEKVWIKSFSRGSLSMTVARRSKVVEPFVYFTASVSCTDFCLEYSFIIKTSDGVYNYNQAGLSVGLERQSSNFKLLQDCDLPIDFYGRTFYQIFPDRFCNGNSDLTPQPGEIQAHGYASRLRQWDQKPLEYLQGYCLDYFGGDLPGIESKLDYLENLGIDGIYLNPIFHAPTHHKYDCQDYYEVDPHLGGNQALLSLRNACFVRDIKLMLDISVNHTGITHNWKKSKPDYYHHTESGIHRWAGVDTLLTLDYENSAVHDEIYSSDNSVLKHWLKEPYKIDAWRFDVAHCMAREGDRYTHQNVWRSIRKNLKPFGNPYLLAEFWDDGHDFLKGDMWDASMNYYGFCRPVRLFFGEPEWQIFRHMSAEPPKFLDAQNLSELFNQAFEELPFQIRNLQYNLLNSHDIHRMSSFSTLDFFSQVQVAALLMFHPGIANIYYGEEIALDGHFKSVEGCRFPMQWRSDLQNQSLLGIYSRLTAMRKHDIFKLGSYVMLKAETGVFVALRFDENDFFLLAIQRDQNDVSFDLDLSPYLLTAQRVSMVNLLDGQGIEFNQSGQFTLHLRSKDCKILTTVIS